ncbi:MAG: hypothetical protein H0V81_18190, partial [Solirubrobacterales bacterium]|nr:hypothetical protein [Solirubrobacterales bacterium]
GGEGLEPGDASRPILADVASGKVAVVLFYNAKGADDRAVRRALKGVDRFKGRVRVRQVPIERVADYPAITQGAPVTQAPTLLVIDTQKRARRLVGYQDTRTIQQLVGDVGGAGFLGSAVARYRERILTMCERFDIGTDATIVATTGDLDSVFSGIRAEALDVLRTVRALDPPRGFSAFQSSYIQQLEEAATVFDRAARAERRNRTGRRKLSSEFAGPDPEGERFDRLARARGLQACF